MHLTIATHASEWRVLSQLPPAHRQNTSCYRFRVADGSHGSSTVAARPPRVHYGVPCLQLHCQFVQLWVLIGAPRKQDWIAAQCSHLPRLLSLHRCTDAQCRCGWDVVAEEWERLGGPSAMRGAPGWPKRAPKGAQEGPKCGPREPQDALFEP
eukprot:5559774-Pyramimonas_sp.AAC.1